MQGRARDILDDFLDEAAVRYEMTARWVGDWTVNDKIFWASVATLIAVGGILILSMTKGSRMGALRQVLTSVALCCIIAYGFGVSTGISGGGMSFVFGR